MRINKHPASLLQCTQTALKNIQLFIQAASHRIWPDTRSGYWPWVQRTKKAPPQKPDLPAHGKCTKLASCRGNTFRDTVHLTNNRIAV